MEKLIFETQDGEEIIFVIEAEVRMSGRNYILVSEDTDDEEAGAMILVDVSSADEEEAVYEEVTDDALIDALAPLFEEELVDTDLEN